MTKREIRNRLDSLATSVNSVMNQLARVKRDPQDAANAERLARKAISELKSLNNSIDDFKTAVRNSQLPE
jgi:hypothetical protein